MSAGFALQLVTVRWLGRFLEDPLDVPGEVLDFVAGQLEMADPSQLKRYTERAKTRFEHQWEIRQAPASGVRRGRGGCWHPFRTQAGTLGDGTRPAYREFHG